MSVYIFLYIVFVFKCSYVYEFLRMSYVSIDTLLQICIQFNKAAKNTKKYTFSMLFFRFFIHVLFITWTSSKKKKTIICINVYQGKILFAQQIVYVFFPYFFIYFPFFCEMMFVLCWLAFLLHKRRKKYFIDGEKFKIKEVKLKTNKLQ